jgi:hypothetical protein
MKRELSKLYSKATKAANDIEHCFGNEVEDYEEALDLLKDNAKIIRDCYNKMSKESSFYADDEAKELMEDFERYVEYIEEEAKASIDDLKEYEVCPSGTAETLSVDILGQFEDMFGLEYIDV